MGKLTICICENKGADQLRGNREADQRLCFRYSDSTLLFYLNPKFQASSSFLCLYRSVCVRPGRKPHCSFFHEMAHIIRIEGTWTSKKVAIRLISAKYTGDEYNREENRSQEVVELKTILTHI